MNVGTITAKAGKGVFTATTAGNGSDVFVVTTFPMLPN
jgi:hypothetical protein